MTDICKTLRAKEFAVGDVLQSICQDHSSNIYAVLSGQIAVYKTSAFGELILLDHYGPGEIVGDPDFNYIECGAAQVVALQPTRVFCFDRYYFDKVMIDIKNRYK